MLWNIGGRDASFAAEANGVEALLEPGVYDLVAMTASQGDVRMFVYEEETIAGDAAFPLTDANAPHAVKLDGVDARGLPLVSPMVRARFVMPDASIVLPPFGRTLHTTSFSAKYALWAMESSFDGMTMHVVQHAPIRGIAGDVTLRNQPADFDEHEMRLQFAGPRERTVMIMPRDWPRRADDFGPAPQSFAASASESTWSMRVRMTREHEGDHVGGLQLSAHPAGDPGATELITPIVRRDDEGFFGAWTFARNGVADTTLDYGAGAIHAIANLAATDASLAGTYDVRGEGGELRRNLATTFRVTDLAGTEVAKGDVTFSTLFAPLPGPGRYRAELRTGASTMTAEFATGTTVPTLRSFAVQGERLTFSTSATPAVFLRRRGAMTWVQLAPVQDGDVYRVDLEDVVRITRDVELLVELRDATGNTASWVTPVLIPGAKRRAVRR